MTCVYGNTFVLLFFRTKNVEKKESCNTDLYSSFAKVYFGCQLFSDEYIWVMGL